MEAVFGDATEPITNPIGHFQFGNLSIDADLVIGEDQRQRPVILAASFPCPKCEWPLIAESAYSNTVRHVNCPKCSVHINIRPTIYLFTGDDDALSVVSTRPCEQCGQRMLPVTQGYGVQHRSFQVLYVCTRCGSNVEWNWKSCHGKVFCPRCGLKFWVMDGTGDEVGD